jgi:hypothetical protein
MEAWRKAFVRRSLGDHCGSCGAEKWMEVSNIDLGDSSFNWM